MSENFSSFFRTPQSLCLSFPLISSELPNPAVSGKAVKFGFTKNATCVVYVSFDAKKTVGKTTTIVEELKDNSALVSGLPAGEAYKSFNVWVGNSGFATSKNIENPVLCFKVEKSWIKAKKVGQTSITLNRYSDKKWEPVPASLSGEDASNSKPKQETRLADERWKIWEKKLNRTQHREKMRRLQDLK